MEKMSITLPNGSLLVLKISPDLIEMGVTTEADGAYVPLYVTYDETALIEAKFEDKP